MAKVVRRGRRSSFIHSGGIALYIEENGVLCVRVLCWIPRCSAVHAKLVKICMDKVSGGLGSSFTHPIFDVLSDTVYLTCRIDRTGRARLRWKNRMPAPLGRREATELRRGGCSRWWWVVFGGQRKLTEKCIVGVVFQGQTLPRPVGQPAGLINGHSEGQLVKAVSGAGGPGNAGYTGWQRGNELRRQCGGGGGRATTRWSREWSATLRSDVHRSEERDAGRKGGGGGKTLAGNRDGWK